MSELYDVVLEIVRENMPTGGGVYLAKPTGNTLPDDATFVEVKLQNKIVYAKMAMPHGWYFVPTTSWLDKYKDEVLFLIAYEAGNTSFPVVIGMVPVDDKSPGNDLAVFKTENFTIMVNDKTKELTIKTGTDGETQEIRLEQGKIVVQSGSGGSITVDATGVAINEASDVAVLGNQLSGFLSSLIDQISSITVTNGAGPTGPPNNIAAIQALKSQISVILSQKVKLL